jgi:hypothetical protein
MPAGGILPGKGCSQRTGLLGRNVFPGCLRRDRADFVCLGLRHGIRLGRDTQGRADVRPRVYKFIIKYVTPLFLFSILMMWFIQEWLPIIMMKGVNIADKPYILGTRLVLLFIFIVLAVLVKVAWRRKKLKEEGGHEAGGLGVPVFFLGVDYCHVDFLFS